MTPSEVVLVIVTEQCGGLKDEVALKDRLSDRLADDLNLDSLDMAEMIMEVEERLDVSLGDDTEAFAKLVTVQDFINFTEEKVKDAKK